MTIECYKSECPKHACHYDPDGGPFCDEPECIEYGGPHYEEEEPNNGRETTHQL